MLFRSLLIADTTSDFVAAIARLWKDQDLRRRLGAAGREHYERNFTWDAVWRQFDESGGL